MASLVDIAASGASVETMLELMAKQLEKRLKALEGSAKANYESKTELLLADVVANMSKLQPVIKVEPSTANITAAPAQVTVMEKAKSSTKFTMSFERNLSGQIENATIVKTEK
jgi:hypothetical protein